MPADFLDLQTLGVLPDDEDGLATCDPEKEIRSGEIAVGDRDFLAADRFPGLAQQRVILGRADLPGEDLGDQHGAGAGVISWAIRPRNC